MIASAIRLTILPSEVNLQPNNGLVFAPVLDGIENEDESQHEKPIFSHFQRLYRQQLASANPLRRRGVGKLGYLCRLVRL